MIGEWLQSQGWRQEYTRFFQGDALPDVHAVDAVVAMGGPMSVHDEARLPWLRQEKAFLLECMQGGVPVLGVCLGAQLMAAALGAEVGPSPDREIGWHAVQTEGGARATALGFTEPFTALHWHGEMFDVPPGGERLASSAGCPNQAFVWGERALGLQFHLEATPESVAEMVTHLADYETPGRWVQGADALVAGAQKHANESNVLMRRLLDAWLTR